MSRLSCPCAIPSCQLGSLRDRAYLRAGYIWTRSVQPIASSSTLNMSLSISDTDSTRSQRYHHVFDHAAFDFKTPIPEYDIVSAFETMGSRLNGLRYAPYVEPSIWTSLGKQTYKTINDHCSKNKIYPGIKKITIDPAYDEDTDEMSVRSEIVYHQSCQGAASDPQSPYTNVTLQGKLGSASTVPFTVVNGPYP